MKLSAILINTSHGALVDHVALVHALRERWIGAARPDVLEKEPPEPEDPLLHLPNAVVTPHVAFYSREALVAVQTRAAEVVTEMLAEDFLSALANPKVLRQIRS